MYAEHLESTKNSLTDAVKRFKDAKMSMASQVVGAMMGLPPQVSGQLAGVLGGASGSILKGMNPAQMSSVLGSFSSGLNNMSQLDSERLKLLIGNGIRI